MNEEQTKILKDIAYSLKVIMYILGILAGIILGKGSL